MKEVKITCDNCEMDITYTGNSIDWRINLSNERIPCGPCDENGMMAVTDMMIYPCMKRNYHFCGSDCMYEKVKEDFGK